MDNSQQPLGVYRYSLIGRRILLGIIGFALFGGVVVSRILPSIVLFEFDAKSKVYLGEVIAIGCASIALLASRKPPFISGYPNVTLTIYPDYFVVAHPKQTVQFKWAEVETYKHDIELKADKKSLKYGSEDAIYLCMQNGKELKLNTNFENFVDMARRFVQLLPPALAPHYIQKLQGGQTFEYIRFTVDMNGLSNKKHAILWSQVSRLEIEKNYVELMFYDDGRQERAFVRLFFTEPNALVLLECIHSLAPQLPKLDVAQIVMG